MCPIFSHFENLCLSFHTGRRFKCEFDKALTSAQWRYNRAPSFPTGIRDIRFCHKDQLMIKLRPGDGCATHESSTSSCAVTFAPLPPVPQFRRPRDRPSRYSKQSNHHRRGIPRTSISGSAHLCRPRGAYLSVTGHLFSLSVQLPRFSVCFIFRWSQKNTRETQPRPALFRVSTSGNRAVT